MIRVDSITITEFRGIRDLTLNFKDRNFAVCGPNGTGKSGVVDALEFVLTGNVSRLSGEGRGDISLKQHGPHVDIRNSPGRAHVKATITIPSLGKTVAIRRTVKTPTRLQVTPSDPAVLEVLRQVQGHPEIVLSRREVIRYVIATPGDRAKEVQALLHLDQVEDVRINLQKIANDCQRQLPPITSELDQARVRLLQALQIADLTEEKVLIAVNAQRVTLGLKALGSFTETTSFKDGIAVPAPAVPRRIPKAPALTDIRAAREALAEICSTNTTTVVAGAAAELKAIAGDPTVAACAKREAFYTAGMELIQTDACPFCDIHWDLVEIKKHVQGKIDELEELARKRREIEGKIAPLIHILANVQSMMKTLVGYAALATPPITMEAARDYGEECGRSIEMLRSVLPAQEALLALNYFRSVPQAIATFISDLEGLVAALPEPTKLDAAIEWLTIAQERFEVFLHIVHKQKVAVKRAETTRLVSDIYAATSDTVLP
jgi:hypothetical protein